MLDALETVHQHDIVHRDVKPSNVFIVEGRAVLADFGIAKRRTEDSDPALTADGHRVGTPGYMAPEQLLEGSVSPATDLYAVAMVLYEALSGRKWSILTSTDEVDWSGIPDTLVGALQRALAWAPAERWPDAGAFRRALREAPTPARAAERDERLPAPSGLIEALKQRRVPQIIGGYIAGGWILLEAVDQLSGRGYLPEVTYPLSLIALSLGFIGACVFAWFHGLPGTQQFRPLELWLLGSLVLVGAVAGGVVISRRGPAASAVLRAAAASAGPARIAVLYFDDLSEDKQLEELSAGLTETLINELSAVEALDVVSKNGVKQFRASAVPLDSIVRALRVGSLVDGSVSRSGARYRVNVELVDGPSGAVLEAKTLERPQGELFQLQDDLAREVSTFLRERLGREIRLLERRAGTSSVEAWGLLLRGERLLDQAYSLRRAGSRTEAASLLQRSDSLLAVAASLDPAWVEPWILRGRVAEEQARTSGDPGGLNARWIQRALAYSERAAELAPGNARALQLRGTLRFRLYQAGVAAGGDTLLGAAERDLGLAVERDPSLASAWATLSELLHEGRADYRRARAAALQAYEQDEFLSEAANIAFRLAYLSLELEDLEQASRWIAEARRRDPTNLNFIALELALLATAGGPEPDVRQAWELVGQIERLSPPQLMEFNLAIARMQAAAVLVRAGLADSARAVARRTRAELGPDRLASVAYDEAYLRLLLGERERALERLTVYLGQAPQDRGRVAQDIWFKKLWDDPEFQALVRPPPHP